jgi:hypothetical protein
MEYVSKNRDGMPAAESRKMAQGESPYVQRTATGTSTCIGRRALSKSCIQRGEVTRHMRIGRRRNCAWSGDLRSMEDRGDRRFSGEGGPEPALRASEPVQRGPPGQTRAGVAAYADTARHVEIRLTIVG